MCETVLFNADIKATETGVYALQFKLGYITHTYSIEAINGNVIELNNVFPVGITHFTLTDPKGNVTCYYIELERINAECPEIFQDIKTVSSC